MASKKTNKQLPSQPSQPEQPKQTLLAIKPKRVEEPIAEPPPEPPAEPPAQEVQVLADVPVLPSEEVKEKLITVKPKPIKRVVTPPSPTKADLQLPSPTKTDLQLPSPTKTDLQPPSPTEADLQSSDQNKSDTEVDPSAQTHNAIFQAVGIITGIVTFNPEGKATVAIQGKDYPLYYSPNHRKAFDALRLQAKKNPDKVERLIVYPRVMHFPKREQHYQMSFQLLGFESPHTTEGISKELGDFEFRLCGLWQFIPVCQTPCISVFKNFTGERLEYIKQAEPDKKVRFMKASHIPIIWRDAPVRPFRFNPKLDKEQQGHSLFVEVLARFLPQSDVFGFIRIIKEPGKAPKFLKAGKKDKAEALKTKLALANKGTTKKKSWIKPKQKDSALQSSPE
ncbi:MAG: hypothetical protein PUP91_35705 [Rhizonema sp. PD37]|nr:hypothetical protein [Rhizonema sp. PD37]